MGVVEAEGFSGCFQEVTLALAVSPAGLQQPGGSGHGELHKKWLISAGKM